ncbi:MAG TPA: TonB-dependent receptor [Blastocatellia bacterium]|nr:TonB-dependent receptor [Blastocatellia bacterium]
MKITRRRLREAMVGLLVVFLLFGYSPVLSFTQTETGQITVKVTDPQGAVVPGATVTVRSVDRGTTLPPVTANEEGIATVTNLLPGLYEVTVAASGFANFVQQAQVTVGSKLSVEANLSPQATSAVVNVVAGEGGVEVNTQTQELSNVVSTTQVRELPTLTRNPYDLVAISSNVSPADPSGRGVGFAINGQRAASTNILLDGGENVDAFTATVGQSVPLDSVQEFRVITSNFSAEYGRATGGIVNVTTLAGTNNFHGTLYEFNRVSKLAANDFDNAARGFDKDVFTRNQFGYSIGGRIIRDKLFFFNNTEWIRVRSQSSEAILVPAPALIAASNPRTQAIFSAFPLRSDAILGRTLTVGEVVSALGVGSGAFAALPANLPAFQEVRFTRPADVGGGTPQNSWQTVARIDWNISDKTQLYGRHAIDSADFFPGTNAFSPFAGFDTGAENFNNNFLANLTHTWSTNLVSQHKLVFNRLNQQQPLNQNQPPVPTFFFRTNVVLSIEGTSVALPGYLPFSPGSAIPFGGPQNFLQTHHDVNWTRGAHQFRFGGLYIHIRDNRTFGAFQNAVAAFGTTSTTTGLNNFVQGNLRRFQVAINPQGQTEPGAAISLPVEFPNFSRSNRYHEFAGYAQDSWRLRQNLTLNLGLRYEYFGVQHNARRELDSNFYLGQGSTLPERIRNGAPMRAKDSPVGALWKPDKNNFAPRVGFAWDVNGDGKMSLRGGYGIAYERNFGNVTFNVIQNPPAYAVITVDPGAPGFPTLPVSTNNFGPLAGASGTVRLPGVINIRHVDENIVNAYAHFWSLAIERQITPRLMTSIEYSGSAGRKLYDLTNDNRIGYAFRFFGEEESAANPLDLLNPKFFPLNTRSNRGRSNYNALILELNSSNLREYGLQFTARYTWSHALDNLSSTFSESFNNFNLGLLDPFNPDLDYGSADFDVRHRFVGSFNWQIGGNRPIGTGFLRQAFGGWTLTGIFTARTGSPFSIFDCTNAAEACPRIVPTSALPKKVPSDPAQNPSANAPNSFILIDLRNQQPIAPTVPVLGGITDFNFPSGMTGRNIFRGPGFWDFSGGLYKNFRITEGSTLQFRGEVFNVFNHPNLFLRGQTAELSSSSFVEGFRTGHRNVQLALKFIF